MVHPVQEVALELCWVSPRPVIRPFVDENPEYKETMWVYEELRTVGL